MARVSETATRRVVELQGEWVTYKELVGVEAKRRLLGGVLHGGRHVDEVALGLFVEFFFKGRDEGIARHWPATRAVAVGAGGRVQGGRGEGG